MKFNVSVFLVSACFICPSVAEDPVPTPLTGFSNSVWNRYWNVLAPKARPSGQVPVCSFLLISNAVAPYHVEIARDLHDEYEVHLGQFSAGLVVENIANQPVKHQSRKIDPEAAEKVIRAWRETLYLVRYRSDDNVPVRSDGTWCIFGALAPSGRRYMMGEYVLEDLPNYRWMLQASQVLRSFALELVSKAELASGLSTLLPPIKIPPNEPKESSSQPGAIPDSVPTDLFPPGKNSSQNSSQIK